MTATVANRRHLASFADQRAVEAQEDFAIEMTEAALMLLYGVGCDGDAGPPDGVVVEVRL